MLSMKGFVREYLFDCKVRNLAPRTIHNYEKQLDYFIRYLKEAQGVEVLEDLRPIHIKQFVVMLQGKKNKPSYVNDLLKAVKCLCAYAYEEGYTSELLTKKVKNVKEPKVLIHTFSDDEIVRMIQHYEQDTSPALFISTPHAPRLLFQSTAELLLRSIYCVFEFSHDIMF